MRIQTTHIDDDALWASMRSGDESAFEELYRRYFQVLFGYGKRVTQDENLVNDTIQDLFVDLWRTRHSLSQAQSVRFYLFSSLRRKIHRSIKQDHLNSEDLDAVSEEFLPTQISPEASFSNSEELFIQTEQLNSWLSQLPPRQNEALVLRYYHNLEYAEIAAILHIKEQTARNLVQKALFILRKFTIYFIIILLKIYL